MGLFLTTDCSAPLGWATDAFCWSALHQILSHIMHNWWSIDFAEGSPNEKILYEWHNAINIVLGRYHSLFEQRLLFSTKEINKKFIESSFESMKATNPGSPWISTRVQNHWAEQSSRLPWSLTCVGWWRWRSCGRRRGSRSGSRTWSWRLRMSIRSPGLIYCRLPPAQGPGRSLFLSSQRKREAEWANSLAD